MIDFRYHLVSIVAVFLALAIGIVLGSTELQGPVYRALDKTTSALQNRLDNADSQLLAAQGSAGADEAWLQANEARVLHDLLAGQKLLIITEPGAQSSVVSGISAAAAAAGATVTGQIGLSPKFFDASSSTSANLAALNSNLAAQDGVQLDSGLQSQQQAAVRVLAGSLLAGTDTTAVSQPNGGSSPATADTVLQAYGQAGYLNVPVGAPASAKATLVVVVTPQAIPADGTQDLVAQALGAIAQELANHATTVVAGSVAGSGGGSPIAVLRGTSVAGKVSTVDDADTTVGQMTVVQALYDSMNGKTGAYGREVGGSPVYPAVSPGATASSGPSSTPSASKKAKR